MRKLVRRNTVRVIGLVTLLLGIVGSPALLASSSSRYGYGHGKASYYDPSERVQRLAYEIEDAAERAHDSTSRRYERGLRSALDDLEDCAEDYRSVVKRRHGLEYSFDDFRGLVRAYNEANAAARYSRNGRVHEELYRVGRLLEEVNDVYAGSRRGYSSGRYDDRRYDDRRYDNRRYDDSWRYRGRGRSGASIVLPRIRINIPF